MTQPNSILLVDDHQLFRTGLKLLLTNREAEYTIIGEASNGVQMLAILDSFDKLPDVILLDIAMPEMDGITAARLALQKYPALKIITLSLYGEEDYYSSLVALGVKGFLLKNSNLSEVTLALDTVLDGGTYFSQGLISAFAHAEQLQDLAPDSPDVVLSEREKEITILICKGMTTNEIAEQLSISPRTVDKHRANILEKTGTKNTANLVVYAVKHKLIVI